MRNIRLGNNNSKSYLVFFLKMFYGIMKALQFIECN